MIDGMFVHIFRLKRKKELFSSLKKDIFKIYYVGSQS